MMAESRSTESSKATVSIRSCCSWTAGAESNVAMWALNRALTSFASAIRRATVDGSSQ
ncbi:MAG: hypothetical protein BWY99_01788 [Synergistetes bacterium ADurb.BinA166]|nr:MAG: hypothetical protein BWY99_01788 [Synergistetes bacterium ADurb.BinA166]